MNHTHKFKEIPLSIYSDKNTVHYRCVECRAVYAIPAGEEWQLNGEIVDDEDKEENN